VRRRARGRKRKRKRKIKRKRKRKKNQRSVVQQFEGGHRDEKNRDMKHQKRVVPQHIWISWRH